MTVSHVTKGPTGIASNSIFPLLTVALMLIIVGIHVPVNTAENTRSELYLSWTGEDGYITDGLEPHLGLSNDDFEFRIMYLDAMGDAPTDNHIKLLLDDNEYNMTTVDHFFTDGSIFNISVEELDAGEHEYHFEGSVRGESIRWPANGNVSGPFVNTAPDLTRPRNSGGAFHNTRVFPELGNNTDLFTFQIVYSDPDNNPPMEGGFTKGVFIDRVFHEMERVTGLGIYYNDNFSDGELYQFTTKLALGEYQYYFEFSDELGATVTSSVFTGPNVMSGYADLSVKMKGIYPEIHWNVASSDVDDWNLVTISAIVENYGGSDVETLFDVEMEIYVIDPQTGEAVPDLTNGMVRFTLDGLPAGEQERVEMEYFPHEKGLFEVDIIIDRNDYVREIVEYRSNTVNNNNRSRRFIAGPDLTISSKDIIPPAAFHAEEVTLVVIVHNQGKSDARFDDDVEVRLSVDDIVLEPTMIRRNTVIRAGMSYKVTFVTKLYSTNGKSAAVSVVVDPKGKLDEAIDHGSLHDNNGAENVIKVSERVYSTSSPSFDPSPIMISLSLVMLVVLAMYCTGRRKG